MLVNPSLPGIWLLSLSTLAQAQLFARSPWPSTARWQSLNESLGGRIENLRPWASVCYSSDPSFDLAACQDVLSGYDNTTAREQSPAALVWSNWEACGIARGCMLNYSNPEVVNGTTCHQGTTPPYTVAIANAEDASMVVKWAVQHEVPLTVKSTGHDLLGRSAAPGTLQVNVAKLQSVQYIPDFVPEGSQGPPVSAITMGSGVHISDVYELAARVNVSVALGSCQTIGAGGIMQAGGHGVLSPIFGLSVDTAVEYEIVTADGRIRKVNAFQDSDLFWAIRGGGSGSWGIITSVTIQGYPGMQVGSSQLSIQPNPAQNSSELAIEFIALVGTYQNQWLDSGISAAFATAKEGYTLLLFWPAANDLLPLVFPFFDELRSRSANYTVAHNSTAVPMYNSYPEAQMTFIGPFTDSQNLGGASSLSSSRLIPRSYLSSSGSARQVAEAIWAGHEMLDAVANVGTPGTLGSVPPFISGNLPGGPNVLKVNETGGNPALYDAAWHVTFGSAWATISDETYNDFVTAVTHAVDPLTQLGIVGSYQGEGNAYEVDWKETFFGYKYDGLTSIKRKYDPDNFFNSWKGVDFEEQRSLYRCYAPNGPSDGTGLRAPRPPS